MMGWLFLTCALCWTLVVLLTLWPVRRNMVLAAVNMGIGMLGGELSPRAQAVVEGVMGFLEGLRRLTPSDSASSS